jgi:hypothetical protein
MANKEKDDYIELLRKKISSALGIPAEMMEPSLSFLCLSILETQGSEKGESK